MDSQENSITFSIVVPLFNKREYIESTVRSVLSQNFGDFEIIIIDDGSTDGGAEHLSLIQDRRIKIFRQKNTGVSIARNNGISKAQGRYVCFIDADDIWARNHLSTIYSLISSEPTAIAWATSYTEFDSENFLSKFNNDSLVQAGHYLILDEAHFYRSWARRLIFWTGSIAVETKTLKNLQPCFPACESLGEDQDLWFRLAEQGFFCYLDYKSTAFYRRNVTNSLTSKNKLNVLPSYLRMKERAKNKNFKTKAAAYNLFRIHMLQIAWDRCLNGSRKESLKILLEVCPFGHSIYWARIFVFSMLPSAIVMRFISFYRSIH